MGKDIHERLDEIEDLLKDVHKLARDLRVQVHKYIEDSGR